ncbi:MAG TPA: translocation/assembly module TamB domain-containing protein, partial [Thermohalobaculum sp.]|nr:translocation/assembly module TamB domain-containing protein [Thermohalobaculum sp.]
SARLRLQADDLLGTPVLDARVTAIGADVGELSLATVQARAAGPLAAIEFSVEAEGSLGREPLTASLAGRADASGPVTTVTLARAEATTGPDSLRLRQPLGLRIGGGAVIAEGLDLDLPEGGRLTGDAAQRPGGFTGDLTLARLPLTVLDRWAGLPVTAGLLDLKAAFDTRPGSAGAEITARGRGIGFEKTKSAEGNLDLDLDAGWNGARLQASAQLRDGFGDPVNARLAVPLRPAPGGVPQVPKRGALDGAVTWAGDIGDLWALVPAVGHILDGQANIDLQLAGTIEAPRVSGGVSLTGGEYQNLDTGTILTGLTVTSSIAEDGTLSMALDGSDGGKGTVSARMALRLGGPPSLDLTAKIGQAVLVRRDDITAQISGDLALAGPLKALELSGALTVERAEVRLVAAAPPEVIELEGIRIKGAPEPEEEDGNGSRLSLDLTVAAPGNIFVRGRGLDSEWKMALAIQGDAARPVVTGDIEKVRGALDLLGRPFDLARGRVGFDGGSEVDPLIDVSLEREAHGIRGGIVVEGRASQPEVRFASVPELPEDEVLPRLLFGQSRQSLSGPQAVQLAAGIATLMSGKAGPLDFAREAVGVDVLRVEGETVEDSSVTVGRNLGEGIFVGARQGLQGQGTTVTVEVEVFEGVKLDSEISQQGNSTVGITWRKDF